MVHMTTPGLILSIFLTSYTTTSGISATLRPSSHVAKSAPMSQPIPAATSTAPGSPGEILGKLIEKEAPSASPGRARVMANAGPSPRLQKVRAEFGKLECAPLTASEDGNGVRVSGFVGSEDALDRLKASVRSLDDIGAVDFQVVVTSPSFCEILRVSLPLHERNSIDSAGASIGVTGNAVVLREGDPVVLRARAPKFDSYIYIVYMQEDGKVLNLLPSQDNSNNSRRANENFSIGDSADQPSFSVAPPYGDDLVMLVAASEPLFPAPRPQFEFGSDFADDLAKGVRALLNKGGKVVADLIFLRTSPRPS